MRRVTNIHRTLTLLAGASLAATFAFVSPSRSTGATGSPSSTASSAYPWPVKPEDELSTERPWRSFGWIGEVFVP